MTTEVVIALVLSTFTFALLLGAAWTYLLLRHREASLTQATAQSFETIKVLIAILEGVGAQMTADQRQLYSEIIQAMYSLTPIAAGGRRRHAPASAGGNGANGNGRSVVEEELERQAAAIRNQQAEMMGAPIAPTDLA